MSSPKPRRRWYQFGLSTLLIGLTLFSLPLGYIAWEREQCRRGEEALAILNRKSVVVWKLEKSTPESSRPKWLSSILGDDHFRRVNVAALEGDLFVDSDLRELAVIPNLEVIWICGSRITDDGIEHLRGLRKVKHFSFIQGRNVSGKSWEVLSGWNNLRTLAFNGTHFGDNGILKLPALTNLTELRLNATNCTDAGLEGIGKLKSLESLTLPGTQVSDAGLVNLRPLTNLRYLTLEDTQVSNAGVQELRRALPNTEINFH